MLLDADAMVCLCAGGHEHGHGHGVEYAGLTIHPPSSWHKNVATGMSALMWCVRVRGRHLP
jgi:hypothetical protein